MRTQTVITGGAGFVGSNLLHHLYSVHGPLFTKNVLVVDRGLFGIEHIRKFGAEIFNVPLRYFCENFDFSKVRSIIHLSGLSNDPMADFSPEANLKFNLKDTEFLIKKVAEFKVPRFIFASSASVYGMFDDRMATEETRSSSGLSSYALSKAKAEDEILKLSFSNETFEPVILRKATIMGVSPRMRFDLVVNTMVMTAVRFGRIELWGGGENWRPLVSNNDVARIYEKLAFGLNEEEYKEASKEKIFNFVGSNHRISELGLRIGDWLKVPVIPNYEKPRDVRSYRLCGNKLKEKIGFEPQFDLEKTVFSIKRHIVQNKLDLDDTIYYNIKFIKNCQRVCDILKLKYDIAL